MKSLGISIKSMLYKYNVRLVLVICSLFCGVLTIITFVLEQPYYRGKPYNYWSGFQDFTMIYPSFVNVVQLLSHNSYGRYFYQKSIPGQISVTLTLVVSLIMISAMVNAFVNLSKPKFAHKRSMIMLKNEDKRIEISK
jgi:hypothetical protein